MGDVFADVVGQERAVGHLADAAANPVHAYLLKGPRGSGKEAAALGFAASLLSAGLDSAGSERAERLCLRRSHPDLHFIEPQGSAYRVAEAEAIVSMAATSPVEGSRKVIVISSVELLVLATIGKLLKVIEEPPATVVFVLLAEEIRPELVTISSRCVTIEFASVSLDSIRLALVESGVESDRASSAAQASGGDLGRARLLASDDALAGRADLWAEIPGRLDGTGSTVAELVDQVREAITAASEPLELVQAEELLELDERAARLGERGSGRSDLVARHKREIRSHRSDELSFGFATLARHFRDQYRDEPSDGPLGALEAITSADDGLRRNPNEPLLLQSLLLSIGPSR